MRHYFFWRRAAFYCAIIPAMACVGGVVTLCLGAGFMRGAGCGAVASAVGGLLVWLP